MKTYYLGSFPPEYGGVTIKNLNLYNALKARISIEKIDFSEIKRKNLNELLRLIITILNRKKRFVIGVAGKTTRKRFCQLLYYINRKAMKKSIIMLMGGTSANDIENDKVYIKYVREFRKIYVETNKMKDVLEKVGLQNIDIYPNGRRKPKRDIVVKNNKGKLKCVFFSQISKEKGADIVLDAALSLPIVDFTFYGHIVENYKDEFLKDINKLENVIYRGVFKNEDDSIYHELNKYDILLFPTKWDSEGVPGILVECKFSAITAIVSDKSFNSEIIKKGEGILLKDNTKDELIEEINNLDSNRELLYNLKVGNKNSSEEYYIENYIDDIVNILKQE